MEDTDGTGGAGIVRPDLPYRRHGGAALIEVRLSSLPQLFNSLDPTPFPDKDLDDEVERYIVGAIQDFPIAQPLRLVIHLPDAQARAARPAEVGDAIGRYFGYRAAMARRDLRLLLRNGRLSLAIGLLFLGACVVLRAVLLEMSQGTAAQVLAEGLLISGWVAMWRPIEIFLYDWWPIRRLGRVYAKAAAMPVELLPTPPPAGPR
ncbi:hypothetical protein [Azospirillum sp. ST 5-10]|uniref:hypothetical protein n=1 Tax=unclassified Azospirillum TaxID=2630922 RepID=UPI003F49DB3A